MSPPSFPFRAARVRRTPSAVLIAAGLLGLAACSGGSGGGGSSTAPPPAPAATAQAPTPDAPARSSSARYTMLLQGFDSPSDAPIARSERTTVYWGVAQ